MWTNTSDKETVVEIELESGNKAIIKQSQPDGFWRIHYERGELPEKLSGGYTTAEYAARAVKTHIETKPRPTKIKETVIKEK